jgi:primary-amine oxidase
MRFIVCLPLSCLTLGRVSARPGFDGPAARYHSLNRCEPESSECASNKDVAVKAPWKNIFQSLTDRDYADVTAYLHKQEELNLTAIVNSTS